MRKPHYAWAILALAVIAVMGSIGLGRFGYTVILPRMRAALGLDDSQAGALASANMAGYVAGALAVGLLGKRIGRRTLVSASLILGAAAMALTGRAQGFLAAALARFLTGLTGAGANITAMGLLSVWFSKSKRGFATGLAVGGTSLGLLVTGLALPPLLSIRDGWRSAWWALAAASALIGLAALAFLRDRPSEKGLAPLGDASGEIEGSKPEPASPRKAAGSLALELIRNGPIRLLSGIYFLYGFSYIIYSTFFIRYLVGEGGFTLTGAGRLWAAIGGCSMVSGLAWGAFSDKYGRKPAFILGLAALSSSFLVFGLWRGLPGFLLSALLFALSAWSVVGVMAAAVGDIMGDRTPQAFGLVTFCFGIGQAIGPLLAGALADRTGSFAAAFVVAAAVAALGSGLSFRIKATKP